MILFEDIPTILLLINIILFITSFVPYEKRKANKLLDKTITSISFLYLITYTATLYNYPSLLENKNNYILFISGIILFCYGLFAAFISNIVSHKFVSTSSTIVFILGSLSYLIHSILKYGVYSINSLSSFLFLIGSLSFLLSDLYNIKYTIRSGWFLFIVGRIVLYLPHHLNGRQLNYHLFK